MQRKYAVAGIEPPLQELMDDQIARLVMQRDGIELADVWRAVEIARSRPAEPSPYVAEESGDPAPTLGSAATLGR